MYMWHVCVCAISQKQKIESGKTGKSQTISYLLDGFSMMILFLSALLSIILPWLLNSYPTSPNMEFLASICFLLSQYFRNISQYFRNISQYFHRWHHQIQRLLGGELEVCRALSLDWHQHARDGGTEACRVRVARVVEEFVGRFGEEWGKNAEFT